MHGVYRPSYFDLHIMELYDARRVQAKLPAPDVSLAFSLHGSGTAFPLVQSQVTHSQRREEREVTIDSVGKETSLAPSG